ncbi:MAG: hypothetical protein ABI939_04810 [Anaerolineaceae bacterium]
MTRTTVLTILTVLGAVFYLFAGIWPLVDSRSFFDQLATFEPYNAHFLHDIGAFQLGIGATLAAALWRRHDAIFAALAGAGIGTAVHAGAHIADRDAGGKDSDVVFFGVLAALFIAGAIWRLMPERKAA